MQTQSALNRLISRVIEQSKGWIEFDRFMALALYAPNLGYYSSKLQPIGLMPSSGSDFVTAPQMSPYFSKSLAHSVQEALKVSQTDVIWEFGAGTGQMAYDVLSSLSEQVKQYCIVELSSHLRTVQAQKLATFKDKVVWLDQLPGQFSGVVLGNEVLDAMPVKLIKRERGVWFEMGVGLGQAAIHDSDALNYEWAKRPTQWRPPVLIPGEYDYLTEIHPQAQAFIQTLADRLQRGVVFLLDYGFPQNEYYHEQRSGGTLMCHQGHLADANPLVDVGLKDITAHVDFTAIALTAQEAGMHVLGYTSPAHFLINSGLLDLLQTASPAERSMAQKLITEHEMGELFKVIALGVGVPEDWEPMGFQTGDRSHTL